MCETCTLHRAEASKCHGADQCVMDEECPFVGDCLVTEAGGPFLQGGTVSV